MKLSVPVLFSIVVLASGLLSVGEKAHADNLGAFRYECVDAGGETYDLTDSSGLPQIRVQNEDNVSLACLKSEDDGQDFARFIELASVHGKERHTHGRAHRHVQRHCLSAGQACWGGYCETECCHSPAGITSLFWYSCD